MKILVQLVVFSMAIIPSALSMEHTIKDQDINVRIINNTNDDLYVEFENPAVRGKEKVTLNKPSEPELEISANEQYRYKVNLSNKQHFLITHFTRQKPGSLSQEVLKAWPSGRYIPEDAKLDLGELLEGYQGAGLVELEIVYKAVPGPIASVAHQLLPAQLAYYVSSTSTGPKKLAVNPIFFPKRP